MNGRQNSPDFVPLFPWICLVVFPFCLLFELRAVLMAKADLFPWLEVISQFRTGLIGLFSLPDCSGHQSTVKTGLVRHHFFAESMGINFPALETSSTNLWKPFAGKKKKKRKKRKKLSSLIQSACFQSYPQSFDTWSHSSQTELPGLPCLENILWRCSPIWKDWRH